MVRNVHQTAKIAPKLLAKWHNRTTPKGLMQCDLQFYNMKTANITPHRTSIYINIFIYLFYIIYIISTKYQYINNLIL